MLDYYPWAPSQARDRITAFISQDLLRAEASSSFEDSGLCCVRIGQEWQQSEVLDAFEGKRRPVNGNTVSVTEWAFKFRAEVVFRKIKRRLANRELQLGSTLRASVCPRKLTRRRVVS